MYKPVIDVDELSISKKQKQLNKLKKLIDKLTQNTKNRLVKFEIKEASYTPCTPFAEALMFEEELKKPLSGVSFIFSAESGKRYICMDENELKELIELYKEALNIV